MGISWNSIPTFCGMFVQRKRFTVDVLHDMARAVSVGNPYTRAGRNNDDGLRLLAERILKEQDMPTFYLDWDFPRTGVSSMAFAAQLNFSTWMHAHNSPKFAWDFDRKFFTLFTWDIADPMKDDRPVFLANLYKRAVNAMQPDFAWLDRFGKQVFRDDRREVDLRQFAWGATCYGPELVEVIGEERLASCPAYMVEKLPWGAYWVQLAENPFKVDARTRQQVQKHLGLKELFNDPEGPRQLMPEGDIRITS